MTLHGKNYDWSSGNLVGAVGCWWSACRLFGWFAACGGFRVSQTRFCVIRCRGCPGCSGLPGCAGRHGRFGGVRAAGASGCFSRAAGIDSVTQLSFSVSYSPSRAL